MRHLAVAGAIALAFILTLPGAAPARADDVRGILAAAAMRHGVPVRLQLAVAAVESGFDPRARNGRSVGLMQVQPGTARDASCRGSLASPAANADCGARVLAILLRDARGDWSTAAARYNAGRFSRGGAGRAYASRVFGRAKRGGP